MIKKLLTLAFVASLGLSMLAGCKKSDEAPVDKATDAMKEGADKAGDAVEKAGDAIEDAADKAAE